MIEGVLAGDRRAVARAISMVEDGAPELEALSAGIYASTGRASTIGLTGAPGVGKSTLATELVRAERGAGRTVAVLAIDPTSPYTGGALLGDRVRMQEHATDPGVFIRSMATRGHLGGMALAAPEAVRVLDAAGYDEVVVETVGVGQAEVEVAAATDTAVVVLSPGAGDAVQMAKAGILEIADVFVVNKDDKGERGRCEPRAPADAAPGGRSRVGPADRADVRAPARGHRAAPGGDRRASSVPGRVGSVARASAARGSCARSRVSPRRGSA